MPQLRQNVITGEWVVIAPERAKRPSDFITAQTVKKQSRETCPFCLHAPAYSNRIKSEGAETSYHYVIPNKFPAFVNNKKNISSRAYQVEDDFYRAKPALGQHEVIITKEHDLSLLSMPLIQLTDLFFVIHGRYLVCQKNPSVEYTMAIYNHGVEAAASIEHPHAQLFASAIIPNQIVHEKHGAEKYFELNGICVFCDLLAHEKRRKIRVIAENSKFIAFTFYAARFPFETWVISKIHKSSFEEAGAGDIDELAKILSSTFAMLDKTLNDPPLNFSIHSLPATSQRSDYYHWHLEIIPRLTNFGGYEIGSSMVIDVVSPEQAAEFLKEKKQ